MRVAAHAIVKACIAAESGGPAVRFDQGGEALPCVVHLCRDHEIAVGGAKHAV